MTDFTKEFIAEARESITEPGVERYICIPVQLEMLDEIERLQSRIAELEALVDELKPYRDGYDPEEVFPPEGEWVWLRDCDDNVEVMGYSQKEKCYWNYEGSRMPDDGDIVRWYPIGKLPEVQE